MREKGTIFVMDAMKWTKTKNFMDSRNQGKNLGHYVISISMWIISNFLVFFGNGNDMYTLHKNGPLTVHQGYDFSIYNDDIYTLWALRNLKNGKLHAQLSLICLIYCLRWTLNTSMTSTIPILNTNYFLTFKNVHWSSKVSDRQPFFTQNICL